MSDFIYSKNRLNNGVLTEELYKIYHENYPIVEEYHGEWGSLGVSRNLYNGFQTYESNTHIFVVIGGPVLFFTDNDFLDDEFSNKGTKLIYNRWIEDEINFDEDLSGPFTIVVINKITSDVDFITDIMSFIPIYVSQNETNTMFSTHVDVLASTTNQSNNIDMVSCADFILHGFITFPHTLYQSIYQLKPASVHHFINSSNKLESKPYWVPKEENDYKSLKEAADDLIVGLRNYIGAVTSQTKNIAQFISGGEDSRVLSALLEKHPRNAFVFLDQFNREGRMAKNAATSYGAKFNLATRSKSHYLDILPECSDLLGSGSQYHHAHTFGFHTKCDLNSYSAVFGGLFSDALLKGARIKRHRKSNRYPMIGDIKEKNYSARNRVNSSMFTDEILDEVTKRRRKHVEYVQLYRNDSVDEWFELWPSSMNMNIPNIHANRRLFKSFEPFMSKDIVKLSAKVPQSWKMNRRLFLKATKPLLKPTKWLFHSDGRLPYFPWYINTFFQFYYKVYRKIGQKLGYIKGNQGPWAAWDEVMHSQEWQNAITIYQGSFHRISSGFQAKNIEGIINDNSVHYLQKINLLQLLYHLNK